MHATSLQGQRRRRFAFWFFAAHLLLTYAMLYWVTPLFITMKEPPPSPTLGARTLGLFIKALALPIILPLSSAGAVDLLRPDVIYLLLNSLCATVIVVAGYALLKRGRGERRRKVNGVSTEIMH